MSALSSRPRMATIACTGSVQVRYTYYGYAYYGYTYYGYTYYDYAYYGRIGQVAGLVSLSPDPDPDPDPDSDPDSEPNLRAGRGR